MLEMGPSPGVPTSLGVEPFTHTPLLRPVWATSHAGACSGGRGGSAWTDGRRPLPSDPRPGLTRPRASRRRPGERTRGTVGPWRMGARPPAHVERHGKGTSARSTEVAPNQPPRLAWPLKISTTTSNRLSHCLEVPWSRARGRRTSTCHLEVKAGDKACGPTWHGFQ